MREGAASGTIPFRASANFGHVNMKNVKLNVQQVMAVNYSKSVLC